MSLLTELITLLSPLIPIETGVFSGTAPERYLVLTPLADVFHLYADNLPNAEVQEVRISLYAKGSYTAIKTRIISTMIHNGVTITARRYVEHENDTKYHHYAIDVAKDYTFERED